VRFIGKTPIEMPSYMDVGVSALKKALLRARINFYDPATVDLLSCLQNVHDVFGTWEWRERLGSIARQFGLSAARLKSAAWRERWRRRGVGAFAPVHRVPHRKA
jgi:hypothetical protein